MLNNIALFIHIVQAGGLAAAAARMRIPPATVTRRLRKLEESVGCQLIHRSARKFALTAEGEAYYQAFGALVHQFEDTARSLSADLYQVTGRLTVAAPTNISVKLLQPMWSTFIKAHPHIQLDLQLSNGFSDLADMQADLALRAGPQPDSQLYQMRLGTVATIVVASPNYIEQHGLPATPEELAAPEDPSRHSIIGVRSLPTWDLSNVMTGQKTQLQLTAATAVDDIGMACQLACDGHGIVLLPVSEIEAEVADGRLIHILEDWQGQRRDLFAVWPSGRLLSARAKSLRDFMQTFIRQSPVLQGGLPAAGGTSAISGLR